MDQGDVRAGCILLEEEARSGNVKAEQTMKAFYAKPDFNAQHECQTPLCSQATRAWKEGDMWLAHQLFDEAARQGDEDAIEMSQITWSALQVQDPTRANLSKQALRQREGAALHLCVGKPNTTENSPCKFLHQVNQQNC